METYYDLAQWAIATLQANNDVVDLVVDREDGVLESGDLDPKLLEEAQRRRRDDNLSGSVLSILVMDTGERGTAGKRTTRCSVYVCDRNGGYGRIRAAREAVLKALLDEPINLVRDTHIVKVWYVNRSGHQKFADFNLDYERIDFEGPLYSYGSGDTYS